MLERVRLDNFQKHKKFDFELGAVTTLVGQSDAGKSAILRAIRWACTNKPRGSAFIKYGEKQTTVRLLLDGSTIKRSTGKVNSYSLDKQEFKAFGTNVPDTIADHLNLDEELNFQSQHDPVFWFSLSAGEVAKRLNAIADLEVIDRCLSDIASRHRRLNAEMNVLETQLAEHDAVLDSLSFVPSMLVDWEDIESDNADLDEINDPIEYLKETLEEYRIADKAVNSASDALEQWDVIEQQKQKYVECAAKIDKISAIVSEYEQFALVCDVDLSEFDEIELLESELTFMDSRIESLVNLLGDIVFKDATILELNDDLRLKEAELNSLEDVCPTCGRPL